MTDEQEVFCGEVVWFNVSLGYGFISWEKNGEKQKDMFTHYSDITLPGFKLLKAGQKVSFAVGQNNSGDPKAVDVVILKNESEVF
jgi:CspA family cold shock protein